VSPFPLTIAHRGAPGRRENTLAGFRDGIANGADWIELDVHLTADKAVAVHHDFTLGGRLLARMTLTEARERAARRRFELPTLEEVFTAVPGHIGVNVEIKAPGIGAAVLHELVQRRAVDRTLVSSFDWPTVRALASRKPRVRTGLLADSPVRDAAGELRRARADTLVVKHRLATARLVEEVHSAGFQVLVWTVNRPKDLRRMIALGVDGIITDYPERMAWLRLGR